MKRNVKRWGAWIMALVMLCSLVMVPAGNVEAAETETYDLLNGQEITETGIVKKDEYGDDLFCEHQFNSLDQTLLSNLGSYSSLTFEAEITVNSSSNENPSVVGYSMDAAYGNWLDDGHAITAIPQTQKISLDLTSYKTLSRVGIRFTQCSLGTSINYTIKSAKIVGVKSSGSSSGGEESGGETSGDVTATVIKKSGNSNWAEYNYTIVNGTTSPISGIKVKVPYNGSVNNLQAWGCSAKTSGNYIVVSYTKVLEAGQTFSCKGSEDNKFGFAGGASLGTPVVEFVYGEDGGGTSGDKLKYTLTGQVKTVAQEDTPVGKHGALKLANVDGYTAPVIVDKNGTPFQLRGASTHGLQWDGMYPYVNKNSFQSLRDEWGVNMVRLASYVTQGGYTAGKKDLLDTKIQEGVQYATDLGMYVIIDWHIHSENGENQNPNSYKAAAKEFFQKYATMYKNYDNVIFELCNEPVGTKWYDESGNDLYTYCKEMVKTIRDCDSNALVVCGTNTWSQDVEDVAKKPLKDDGFDNVLYTFHFYAATHYENLMQKVKTATADKTPIFVTEFGICRADGNGIYDTANADAWIKLLDEYNISYACWSLCNKNEAAAYLLPSCSKVNGGWVESDLSTTGKWLVNTYRAHEDAENGKDTSIGDFSISVDPEKGVLDSVLEGYTDAGKATITIKNTSDKDLTDLSVKLSVGKNFALTKDLESTTLAAGQSTTVEVSLAAGKAAGTYADTVTIQSGTIKKVQNVKQVVTKVEEVVAVEGITLSPTEATLEIGATETLKATVTPTNATNKKVTWSSSNDKIAKVDTKGVVTAVAAGTATITVTTVDGEKTATCEVTVKKPAAVQSEIVGAEKVSVVSGTKLRDITAKYKAVAKDTDITDKGTFSWKKNGEAIVEDTIFKLADAGAYTLVFLPADTNAYATAELPVTITVTKKENTLKPIAPTVASKTDSSVTLSTYVGDQMVEYGIKQGNEYRWQESPKFEKLSPYSDYTFALRYAATDEVEAGAAGASVTVKTYLSEKDTYIVDLSKLKDAEYVEAHNETITYDSANKLLTLNNKDKTYTLTGDGIDITVVSNGAEIILVNANAKSITSTANISVKLEGENVVKEGLASDATITIDKNENVSAGKLTVDAGMDGAIVAGKIIVNGGDITANGTDSLPALKADTEIDLIGGNLTANVGETATSVIPIQVDTENENATIVVGGCTVGSNVTKKNNPIYNIKDVVDQNGEKVVFATITFKDDDEIIDQPKEAALNSKITLPSLPIKKGYHPEGWRRAGGDPASVEKAGNEQTVDGDITFEAVYTEITGTLDVTVQQAQDLTTGYVEDGDGVAVKIANNTNVTFDELNLAIDSDAFMLDESKLEQLKSGESRTVIVKLKNGKVAGNYTTQLTVTVSSGEIDSKQEAISRTVQNAVIAVTGINVNLDKNAIELTDDQSATVNATATVSPENATNKQVTWTTGDSKIATVDSNGVVTVLSEGTVDIIATAADGSNITGKATLTVTKKKTEEKPDPGQNPGGSGEVEPGKDTSKPNGSGGQNGGSGTGATSNTLTQTPATPSAADEVKATGIQVTADVKKADNMLVAGTMKLAPKKKMQLNVAFLPEDADEEEVTFTSSNPKVAIVDEDGEVTAGKNPGKTTITVKTESGLVKTFQIQVMKKAVTKVKLQVKTKKLKVGKTMKVKATLSPNKKLASNIIYWTSSNEDVVTVTQKGVIKGLKKGKAKITAVAADGSGKKATVTIKVK